MNFVRVYGLFTVTLVASRLIPLDGMGLCQLDELLHMLQLGSEIPVTADVTTDSNVDKSTAIDDLMAFTSPSLSVSEESSSTRLNLTVTTMPFKSTEERIQTSDYSTITTNALQTTYTTQGCQNDKIFVSADCTECNENRVICNSSYGCSPNATCTVSSNGTGQCICNRGYTGDGQTCSPLYKDCYQAYQDGHTQNGVYTILPAAWPGSPFNVSCDMTTSGGGWLIFQRRIDGETEFYRDWANYKHGFGSLDHGREFWLGNEKLYYLINQTEYKLRVDIVTSSGSPKYQEYERFRIGNEDSQYQLTDLGKTSGTAGDGLSENIGGSFSTYDRDNDGCALFNCAEEHRGAWWYIDKWCRSCWNSRSYCDNFETGSNCNNLCAFANLNGLYNGGPGKNINWRVASACNIKSTEMKISPSSL